MFSANAPDQNGNTWIVSADASQRGVTVTVTPNDGSCAPWKAASSADWITVSPTSGTTSTTVAVNYSANTKADARTGNVSFTWPDCAAPNCGLTVGLNQGSSTPPPAPLQISVICYGPYRPGDIAACFIETTRGPFADLSTFGGPAEYSIPPCPACGGPPWTYDLPVRVPADMTPGVKTIAIWATDAQGHRVNATASIGIVSR